MNQVISTPDDHGRELAEFTKGGMLSAETQKKLSLAITTLGGMKQVSTPVGQRHFSRIDTMLTLKSPSPANQARECLHALDKAWSHIREDFHRFREMSAQVKLRRAKLNKKLKECPDDEDDKAIVEAECYLEQTQIDALESELKAGEEKFRNALKKATVQADSYALICKNAGKESFTEADFAHEEAIYLLKSAWWHAVQAFTTTDVRNKTWRESTSGKKMNPRNTMQIDLEEEVTLYFKGLGIGESTVKEEVAGIEGQRNMHEMHFQFADEGVRQPFRPYFEAWLDKMAQKYAPTVLALMKTQGLERLRRMDSMITPTNDDKGGPGDSLNMARPNITKI